MENILIYETYLDTLQNSGYSRNTIAQNLLKNILTLFNNNLKDTDIPPGIYKLFDILNYYCIYTYLKFKKNDSTEFLLATYEDYVKNKKDILLLLTEKEKGLISLFTSINILISTFLLIKFISKKIKSNEFIKKGIINIVVFMLKLTEKISSIKDKKIDINKYDKICKLANLKIHYTSSKISVKDLLNRINNIHKIVLKSNKKVIEYILARFLSTIFINVVDHYLIVYYTKYFPTGYLYMLERFALTDFIKIVKQRFDLDSIISVSIKRLTNMIEKYTVENNDNSKTLDLFLILVKIIIDLKDIIYELITYIYVVSEENAITSN